ncbi:hypothetical protein PHYPSEUDO_003000 [Phytophthora pseudosyringae]|uniref:Transmembrane protein n=1 Tax=Phytophthora pseudosyringae TaxID=221518 RepID=A0A8T1VRV4_9STRA|nr:hypothetical protein PHYPSEUDO_003000 [Phytophthora pseudosyringae]
MSDNSVAKDSIPSERSGKDKKQLKDGKPKVKKTRRHVREEARAQEVPQAQETKTETDQGDPDRPDNAASLSPSAIVEMFHLQDEEKMSSTSVVTTARYLVENETSGDFYQVRARQRPQHAHFADHARHRRSSLVKAQQKVRDGSVKAEKSMFWTIFQRDGEKAVVVMILGVVAGICWMDAMNLRSRDASSPRREFDNFLCAYSAGSNRSRKSLFILFKYPSPRFVSWIIAVTIIILISPLTSNILCVNQFTGVLIGLTRKLNQMKPHREYKVLDEAAAAEITSFRLLQMATALVSTALLVLLIGSPSALRLSRAQQANAKWCEEVAPTSTLFQNGVVVLQVCAILNTALITAAWFLVALQCSVTISSSTSSRSRIVELQDALADHKQRIGELQGTHLEGSSAEDLKSLIQLHQRAIELTEGVLVSKLQVLHRPTAAG